MKLQKCDRCGRPVLVVELGDAALFIDVLTTPRYLDGAGVAIFAHHGRADTCSATPAKARLPLTWPEGSVEYEVLRIVPRKSR